MNDDDIVGGSSKMAKKKLAAGTKESTRDWGKGFACTGRNKTCTKVDKNHFGPIPGIEVGMAWKFRMQISEEGLHRPPVAGIAGTDKLGCPSLILSGGYEDDEDHGDWFTYTGAGGRDLSGNKRTAEQSFDQKLDRSNAAIARNCKARFDNKNGGDAGDNWREGKPIRVLRNYKAAKHSKYAPEEGIGTTGSTSVCATGLRREPVGSLCGGTRSEGTIQPLHLGPRRVRRGWRSWATSSSTLRATWRPRLRRRRPRRRRLLASPARGKRGKLRKIPKKRKRREVRRTKTITPTTRRQRSRRRLSSKFHPSGPNLSTKTRRM